MSKCCERNTIDAWVRPDVEPPIGRIREFHDVSCAVFIEQMRRALVEYGMTTATADDARRAVVKVTGAEKGSGVKP